MDYPTRVYLLSRATVCVSYSTVVQADQALWETFFNELNRVYIPVITNADYPSYTVCTVYADLVYTPVSTTTFLQSHVSVNNGTRVSVFALSP